MLKSPLTLYRKSEPDQPGKAEKEKLLGYFLFAIEEEGS